MALGIALQAGAYFLPNPYQTATVLVGAVALYLAGKGFKAPDWAAGKPLLPAALVPLALSAMSLLATLGPILPPVLAPHVGVLSGLLGFLAGKVEPAPVKVSVSGSAAPGTPSVLGAAAPTTALPETQPDCSLEDAGRGLCK